MLAKSAQYVHSKSEKTTIPTGEDNRPIRSGPKSTGFDGTAIRGADADSVFGLVPRFLYRTTTAMTPNAIVVITSKYRRRSELAFHGSEGVGVCSAIHPLQGRNARLSPSDGNEPSNSAVAQNTGRPSPNGQACRIALRAVEENETSSRSASTV